MCSPPPARRRVRRPERGRRLHRNVRRDGGQRRDETFSRSGRADLARVNGLATGKQSKSIHFRVCPTTARFASPIQDLSDQVRKPSLNKLLARTAGAPLLRTRCLPTHTQPPHRYLNNHGCYHHHRRSQRGRAERLVAPRRGRQEDRGRQARNLHRYQGRGERRYRAGGGSVPGRQGQRTSRPLPPSSALAQASSLVVTSALAASALVSADSPPPPPSPPLPETFPPDRPHLPHLRPRPSPALAATTESAAYESPAT